MLKFKFDEEIANIMINTGSCGLGYQEATYIMKVMKNIKNSNLFDVK